VEATLLVRFLDSAKGKAVKIPLLDSASGATRGVFWDLFAATQKNFKPGEGGGARDICSG